MHGAMCDYTDNTHLGLAFPSPVLSISCSKVSASLKPSLPPFQTLQVEVFVSPKIFSQISMLTFLFLLKKLKFISTGG